MAKNFKELQAKMPPEAHAKAKAEAEKIIREMPLHELRAARLLTQEHLGKVLGVNQSAVSKIERRTDMYVSTLADFVRAMGGRLEIRAIFPDGVVSISQFQEREGTPAEGRQPQVRTAELTRT